LGFAHITFIVPVFVRTLFLASSTTMRRRPQLRLRGIKAPTVDVLITTCGEPVDIIIDTVRSTCYLDYPKSRYRIIICDDASDSELKQQVIDLSGEHPNLYYHARIKGQVHNFKAGNLQSGIDFSCTLPGGPGELIATLDSDMIPARQWLRAMIPHLLYDKNLALCGTPQVYP
jgi:cellulose synthase/poly-beta-1,6-N-acetylglucosamine synthase-like glycosyltransferase